MTYTNTTEFSLLRFGEGAYLTLTQTLTLIVLGKVCTFRAKQLLDAAEAATPSKQYELEEFQQVWKEKAPRPLA